MIDLFAEVKCPHCNEQNRIKKVTILMSCLTILSFILFLIYNNTSIGFTNPIILGSGIIEMLGLNVTAFISTIYLLVGTIVNYFCSMYKKVI